MTIDRMKAALLGVAANGGKAANPEAQKLVEAFTSVTWTKAPKGSKCPSCGKEALERSKQLMGGPWSGSIRCKGCGHTDTLVGYLGKTIVEVQPLTTEEMALKPYTPAEWEAGIEGLKAPRAVLERLEATIRALAWKRET
jgi:hypothetical protein